ncbi:nucleotide-diphospho-sugar transferase [Thelonectria olida]|uniref:Nucleotide-diphospho-sugar transferase n=1 Tax=Thelonectria olida TaxID=1576542 RepID=A0A9P9ARF7_9HYPO|nr:nucleotide-diphospho-sugar transferase [Thelonectria olida]
MVTRRGRLRIVALALIICTILFWHTRSRGYDYTYSQAPNATLEKPTGIDFEKEAGYFDNDTNELRMPTPAHGGRSRSTTSTSSTSTKSTSSTTIAQETTPSRQTEDGWRSKDADEEERLYEEMDKYEGVQENPESGVFLDKGAKSGSDKTTKKILHQPPPIPDKVDWSRFAYTQYVTNADYLCNSVMIFETLHRLGSKADRLMMYPNFMLDPTDTESDTPHGKLLIQARDKYNVKLMPVEVQHREGADATWADSFTKLLAFNQTQYDRVLSLDSDGAVLQPMDELFLLPPSPVAMPRAYWLLDESPPKTMLSSQVVLIQPDTVEFERIIHKIATTTENDYDMEIVNDLYRDSAMILPHRPYDMLTGEWRRTEHSHYLGSDREVWDPATVLSEAKFIHFSDWPVPKPWMFVPEDIKRANQPRCRMINGEESCLEQEIWNRFYTNFAEQRLVSKLDLC